MPCTFSINNRERASSSRIVDWIVVSKLNLCQSKVLLSHFASTYASNQISQRIIHHFCLAINLEMCYARKLQGSLNLFHKVSQKATKKLLSLSEVMERGTPCKQTTSLNNNLATWCAYIVLWHGMKCNILENWSTTTSTDCITSPLGSWKTKYKSIEMLSQGALRMYKGMYKLVFCDFPLHFWQVEHLYINFPASMVNSNVLPN